MSQREEAGGGLLVSVEGGIGAGKSTLLRAVERCISNGQAPPECTHMHVLQEPVDEWCEPRLPGGRGMLQAFYADPVGLAFPFQMFVLLSRVRQTWAMQGLEDGPILSERCIASDFELFGRPAFEAGRMDDAQWATYHAWYNAINERLSPQHARPHAVVYLRCPPEVTLQRVAERGREGEAALDLEAAERMHACHEAWIARLRAAGTPVLELDCRPRGEAAIHNNAMLVCKFVASLVKGNGCEW